MIGHGCKFYWTTKWNYIDVVVLATSYADISISIYTSDYISPTKSPNYLQTVKTARYVIALFRLARLSRSLRLFRVIHKIRFSNCFDIIELEYGLLLIFTYYCIQPLLPRLNAFIDGKVNYTLFLGYDIGKGLVTAVDDVLKFLPQMVEHPRVLAKLKTALENERLETIRALGNLH